MTIIILGITVTITATMVIQAALLAASVIIGIVLRPKIPPAVAQTLQSTLDPAAFRVTVLGYSPVGNDIRYWEVYGATRIDQVIAAATHPITAWGPMYINGMQVTFSGPDAEGVAAQGTIGYPGYVPANTSLYNPTGADGSLLRVYYSSKGITGTDQLSAGPVGATGAVWGSNYSFTGCAYYLRKWNADPRFLTSGIPSQVVQVAKGSPVYDPRKDSTVGGSGSHRASDNTTWQYTPTDSNGIEIGRNNALQMLRYLLGWFIINPTTGLAVQVDGRGVNPADINMASFIAAANVCETEEYYSDCALSTGNSHTQNEATISAGSQGVLIDTGGQWSYQPAYDDTASIAVAFTEDDIISGISWIPLSPITEQYNQVGGNFVDPSVNAAVYQSWPYPTVLDSTYLAQDNGFPRQLNLDFNCIQDPALCQKLARIALNKTRLSGQFTATFNYKALQAQLYSCVTVSFPPLGFSANLFRVVKMSINPMGGVDMVLQEEESAVYTGGTINSYIAPLAGPGNDGSEQIALGTLTLGTVELQGSINTANDGITVTWPTVASNVAAIQIAYQPSGAAYFIAMAPIPPDVTEVIIPNVLEGTSYVVIGRAISINNTPGPYSTASITTSTYTTATQNQTFSQGTDPSLTVTVNNGAIWADTANGNLYARIASSWVLVANIANNSGGSSGTGTGTGGLSIATTTIPSPTQGTAYSQYIVGSGGTTPYTWSISAGTIPSGVGISSSTGLISGTPTGSGSYSFTVKITDHVGNTATQEYAGSIIPATISDGTVVYSSDTPGAFSFTVNALNPSFMQIELWGPGFAGTAGSGGSGGKGTFAGEGGSAGGYCKHHIAVTPGTTVISGTLGSPSIAVAFGSSATAGTDSSISSLSLLAKAATALATPGTASGGNLANTTGDAGGSPDVQSGGGAAPAFTPQNTASYPGTVPGGGGAGGSNVGSGAAGNSANGHVILTAKAS